LFSFSGFLLGKVALGQVFLEVFWFSPGGIILPVFDNSIHLNR
jgi:hypothetical protein